MAIPEKYDMKILAICEINSSYAWEMQLYTGKNASVGRELTKALEFVKNLVKKIENCSRNITCNNFFTSVLFASELPQTKRTLAEASEKTNRSCLNHSLLLQVVR